jgi:hypothetical protein
MHARGSIIRNIARKRRKQSIAGSGRARTQRGQPFGSTNSAGSSMTNADTHQFISYTPRDTAGDTLGPMTFPKSAICTTARAQ